MPAKKPAGYYSKAAKAARVVARAKRKVQTLTDHQQARRARKSAKFFGMCAARAALRRDFDETRRLSVYMFRKESIVRMVGAVLAVRAARFRIEASAAVAAAACILAACSPAPRPVLVGLDCQGEHVRLYGAEDGPEAARACRTVEIHQPPARV